MLRRAKILQTLTCVVLRLSNDVVLGSGDVVP